MPGPIPFARLPFLLIALLTAWITLGPAAADELPEREDIFQWRELERLPDPQGVAAPFVGVSDDALIVAGGANFPDGLPWEDHAKHWYDHAFVLEDPDGQWQQIPDALPRPLAYGTSVNWNGKIVCIAGEGPDQFHAEAFILTYDREQGTIQTRELPDLPEPLAFHASELIGDTVYVVGGLLEPGTADVTDALWALDLSAEQPQWQQRAALPGRGRMLLSVATQGGELFALGGVGLDLDEQGDPTRTYLDDAYRYDPAEDTWRAIADLPNPVAAAPTPAMAIGSHHIAVLAGDGGQFYNRAQELGHDHPGFAPDIYDYNTITDRWVKTGEFPKDPGPDSANQPQDASWPPVTTNTTIWDDAYIIPTGEARPGMRTNRVRMLSVDDPETGFTGIDTLVIALYMALLVAMGFYFSRREHTTGDFFLGGRRIPWWAAGISVYGTQLSAITFLAIPGHVFANDWRYLVGNMMIIAIAPVVIYLYLPFFRRLNVTTAYQYLGLRFNTGVHLLGSLAFVLLQLGRMGIVLFLPSLALAAATGFDIFLAILIMGVLATLYTYLGGIEAVVWTDVIQVLVLLGGALLSLVLIIAAMPEGMSGMAALGGEYNKFRMADWSWSLTSAAIGVVILGRFLEQFVPYTADQTVVQRYLTTRDEKAAARSIWTNAVMTLPVVIFFLLGTALWAFYHVFPAQTNPTSTADQVYPWFIAQHLPIGFTGLILAAIFAASMSSLDSTLNSMSAVLTTDFYRRMRKNASEAHFFRTGRTLTLALGVLGTSIALYMAYIQSEGVWDLFTEIIGLFGGGLAGLFALGILTRRGNAVGAAVGFLCSAVILYIVREYTQVHFFLYAGIGLLSCLIIGYLISLLVPMGRAADGLTVWTMLDRDAAQAPPEQEPQTPTTTASR